jgi:hypothetical protein
VRIGDAAIARYANSARCQDSDPANLAFTAAFVPPEKNRTIMSSSDVLGVKQTSGQSDWLI